MRAIFSVVTRAFIFDVDGVVVDSEPLHLKAFQEVFSAWGVRYTRKVHYAKFIGTGSRHIMGTIFRRHKIKEPLEPWLRIRANVYQRMVAERSNLLKVTPGVRQFVAAARRARIKIAFASGGRRENVLTELKAAGFDPRKFVVLTEEDIKKRKPDPEIFLKAAAKLKVKPAECVVFEDSPSGIKAAKQAGIFCVALTTTTPAPKLKKLGADVILKDFRSAKSVYASFPSKAPKVLPRS